MKSLNFLEKYGLCKLLTCERGMVRELQVHAANSQSERVWERVGHKRLKDVILKHVGVYT